MRAVNAFLSHNSLPFSLNAPYPSSKDIAETVRFILSQFGDPDNQSQNFEDDFHYLLKSLNFQVKWNGSALRAPGAPHVWPHLLAAIHSLVQLLMYDQQQLTAVLENRMIRYFVQTYMHFIVREDDEVENLDHRIKQEMVGERQRIVEEMKALERIAQEFEGKLEGIRGWIREVEGLKAERTLLEGDRKKFRDMIERLERYKAAMSALLEEKGKGLEVKIAEKERICVENEMMKKRVEEQGINARNAERMKLELRALEGNIAHTEDASNVWEDKEWELESMIESTYRKLQQVMIEANRAMARLKLGKEYHFQLDANVSSSSSIKKVLGIDYKSILRPALASLEEEIVTPQPA